MIGELEAVHVWDAGAFTMNDRIARPGFVVDEIDGLTKTGDFEAPADIATGRPGENPRRGDREGLTVTYTGRLIGRTRSELSFMKTALTAAFEPTDERRVDVGPHAAYIGAEEIPLRYYYARSLEAGATGRQDHPPTRTRSRGWERPATVALRLSDPRFYFADPADVVEVTDDTRSAVDGTGVPYTPGEEIVPSGNGFSIVTFNPGTAHVPAIITLEGPWVNPLISNETIGKILKFRDLDLDAGELLTIDFRRETIRRPSGANMADKLRAASTWWDPNVPGIVAESNTIVGRGQSIGAGASMTVTYTPADFG